MDTKEKLRLLELRVVREHRHFREALAATRGIFERAFTEMRVAFLEQEAVERSHSLQMEQEFSAMRQIADEDRDTARTILEDHEARLRRLEERLSPPAA